MWWFVFLEWYVLGLYTVIQWGTVDRNQDGKDMQETAQKQTGVPDKCTQELCFMDPLSKLVRLRVKCEEKQYWTVAF